MWTVLYWTWSSRTQLGVSKNVCRLAGDTLNITCNFLYCNHLVNRDFWSPYIPSSSSSSFSSSSPIGATTFRWVSTCSTIVERSQQEGFTECRCQGHVKPPTWRRTKDLERSIFRHKRPPASEATIANPVAEGGTMGEKWSRISPKVATSTSLLDHPVFTHHN
jgi:hypothetical protein